MVETRGQRDLVAEVARQPDHANARVALVQREQELMAAVRAAVVDEEDLRRAVECVEHRREPPVELVERLALVEDWEDERVLGCHAFAAYPQLPPARATAPNACASVIGVAHRGPYRK